MIHEEQMQFSSWYRRLRSSYVEAVDFYPFISAFCQARGIVTDQGDNQAKQLEEVVEQSQ